MNTLNGYSKSTLTDNYVLSAAGGHLPLVAGRLWRSLTSVTIEEANVVWYIKVEIPGYSKPSSMLIQGSYNNIIDLGLVEFSGFSYGYIYRNIQQNNGNVTAVCMSKVHDSTTKKWTFWIKMRPINNSSGELPTLSATYKIYFSESYTITATATTTDPGVVWQNTTTNLVIKNADLIGKSTNIAGGAKGSIPYQSAANTTAMLGIGSKGQVLKVSSSGLPEWSSDTNTDTKVTQTVTNSNANYPLLLAPAGQTAVTTTTSYFDSGVTLNPSTNILDGAKVYESLLQWGNTAIAGSLSPLDVAMDGQWSSNRLSFMPASGIDIEYSTDGGTTWLDYGSTDDQKRSLVTTGLSYYLSPGKNTTRQKINSDRVRITITAESEKTYFSLKKIYMYISQNGASGCKVLIEKSQCGSDTTFTQVGEYAITVWSGWNSIPLTARFGGSDGQTENIKRLRFTYYFTKYTIDYGETDDKKAVTFNINKLNMIGETSWVNSGGSLAATGHLYSYDINKNVIFPAKVTANVFVGSLSGNASSASTVTVGIGSGNVYRPIVIHNGNALYSAGTATGKPCYNYTTGDIKAKSFTTDGGVFTGNLSGTASNASKLSNYSLISSALGLGYYLSNSGATTSNTSDNWCRIASWEPTSIDDTTDVCFIIHSAFLLEYGILHVDTRKTGWLRVNLLQSFGLVADNIRVYYNLDYSNIQVYAHATGNYKVYNFKLLYATDRNGLDATAKITMYSKDTTATTLTDYKTPSIKIADGYIPSSGDKTITGTTRICKNLGGNLSDFGTYQYQGPLEVGKATDAMCLAIGVTDDGYGYIQSKGNNITNTGYLIILPRGGLLLYGQDKYPIIHSNNYTEYTVTKTGTGATGTWGINISGTASIATHDGNGKVIADTYLPFSGGTTTDLITLGASSYENTIKWANSDYNSATAKAFMGRLGDWVVRVTYVKDLLGNTIPDTNFELRYNRNSLQIGDYTALTSGNWFTHINLSTYATQTYVDSQIAKAQLAGSNVVIPVTDVLVKTSGNFTTVVSENVAKIDLSAYATTENLEDYLPLSGGVMSGVITTASGNSKGLKFGTSYLTSLSNLLIWQSSEAIRFGSSDLDWNNLAGLKYDRNDNTIYLGLADLTIFNATSAQSEGKVKFPGVIDVYVNRLIISSKESSVKHLQFSNNNNNYISAPSGGTIVILPNGAIANASNGMTFTSSGFYPLTNAGYNLGTSSYMWNNVYGNYGKFQKELHSPNIYLKTPTASTAFGLIYVETEGTTSTVGSSYIKIGNNVSEGSDKNSRGLLVIYGTKAGANQILSRVTSSSTVSYYLPKVEAYSVYAISEAAVGGASTPVYVDANGQVNACTYSLNKTVPLDAVFTDTKNTAGSTNNPYKMYLIGATSQAANPQTYSNSAIYATDGTLTTSGVGKDGYIAYPKDGYYSSSKVSETGYLCITLPLSWTDTMIKFDINIFNYLNNTSVTYTISGYMYSPDEKWFNVAAYAVGHHLGDLSNLPVIFGHNGTKCVVYIGTDTTTWRYPKIAISNITLGWSNTTTEKWSTGWGFSFTTSLGTYDAIVQNTYVGYLSQLLQGKSAKDFTEKHLWECVINENTWSRLCHVEYAASTAGASYILNVLEHRNYVVYNYTYLVNTHYKQTGHITLLNNSDFPYSGDSEARLIVDTYGNSYFEFRDGIRLTDSWTSTTVICELIPLSTGDITKYTTYTSGSSIPSDYVVATTVLHTGEGIPNIDNYWKYAYNLNDSKTLNAPSKNLTFNSDNIDEVLLAETVFSTPTIGMPINLSFSGSIKAYQLKSGYSDMDCTTHHIKNNELKYIYYVYVDNVQVGAYRLGHSFLALVVNSGTSMHVAIKVKLNKNFTTNSWWYCSTACDFYINSTNIEIESSGYIQIKATASYAGNVLRNSEYVSYKNGFVFSDINSNSLTYCDKNQVIVKRGGICFKLDSSGLTQSSDSGSTWSPITSVVSTL